MKENKKLKIIREWVQRFKTGKPEAYMDEESLAVWKQMQQEGWEVQND